MKYYSIEDCLQMLNWIGIWRGLKAELMSFSLCYFPRTIPEWYLWSGGAHYPTGYQMDRTLSSTVKNRDLKAKYATGTNSNFELNYIPPGKAQKIKKKKRKEKYNTLPSNFLHRPRVINASRLCFTIIIMPTCCIKPSGNSLSVVLKNTPASPTIFLNNYLHASTFLQFITLFPTYFHPQFSTFIQPLFHILLHLFPYC